MDYLPNLAAQTRLFLLSMGFGFALGVVYDVFRVVRLLLNKSGRAALLAQDLLYSLLCTGLSFFFFLAAGEGVLRLYGLGGEIFGWVIYYVSLGPVALRASGWAVKQLRRFAAFLAKILRAPFVWLLRQLEKAANPLRRARLKAKKIRKNLHLGLQSSPGMLYNKNRSVETEKEKPSRAKQQRRADWPAKETGTEFTRTAAEKAPYDEPRGAGGGAGVYAVRGVPAAARARGRGKGQRGKRGV